MLPKPITLQEFRRKANLSKCVADKSMLKVHIARHLYTVIKSRIREKVHGWVKQSTKGEELMQVIQQNIQSKGEILVVPEHNWSILPTKQVPVTLQIPTQGVKHLKNTFRYIIRY